MNNYDPNDPRMRGLKSIDAENYQEINNINTVSDENQDVSIWEIDTKPLIEEIYYDFLGMSKDGVSWVEDESKTRQMNEKGASKLISILKIRINKAMLLSDIEEVYINRSCEMTGKVISDLLTDYWEEWEITPRYSNLMSIADAIIDLLYIALCSARRGGMKSHRERSKFPNPISYMHNSGV